MLISYKRGQGSIVLRVKILDSSVSTGDGKTGLAFDTAGLIVATIADNESVTTRYRASSGEIEDITTLGTYAAPTSGKCRFKEVDATNHPGVYEIQLADARFAVAGAKSLLVSISGASNAAQCDVCIPLTDLDPYDAVRAGLTALPNAAAEAEGGLITRGSSAGQLNVSGGKAPATLAAADVSGNLPANVMTIEGNDASDIFTAINQDLDLIESAIAALNDLSQADVRTAVGLAAANLDTQLSTIAGYLDTEIASIISTLSTVLAAVDTEVAAIKAKTDNLPSDPADQSAVEAAITNAQTVITAAIDALNDLSQAQAQAAAEAAIVTYKLDHLVAVAESDDPVDNSIIAKLASATGDWSTFVSGTDSLEAQQAEHDATQSLVNTVDTIVDAIQTKTDQLNFTNAGKVNAALLTSEDIAAAVCQKIAHILLRRTMASVEAAADGDALSLSSLYGLIQMAQEATISGTTLTVKQTDGATSLGTKTLHTNASAEPITGIE